MARVAVTPTTVGPNAGTTPPAGSAIADLIADGVNIAGIPLEELVLEVTNTFNGAKNVTIQSGDSPPALDAGQGDLVVAVPDGDPTAAVRYIGPFTSGRFAQSDGSLDVDFEASMTGTFRALHIPRTA